MSVNFEAKYELKKLFIVALRQMFANDTEFPYNDNDTLTSLIITNKMPINTEQNQLPHIVWQGASYSVQQDTLGNNFYSEVAGKRNDGRTIANAGKKFTSIVNFSVSIMALSTVEDEAASIADRVFDYIYLEYPEQLQAIGLFVSNLSVSDTSVRETSPQIQYACQVSIQGHLRLTWTSTPVTDTALVSAIKLNLSTYQ